MDSVKNWDDQTPNYDEAKIGVYVLRVTATSKKASFDQNRTVCLGLTVLVAVLGW